MTKDNLPQATFTSNHEWFDAFLRNTDNKQVLRTEVIRGLQTRFPKFWVERIANPDYNLSVQYIGAGSGGLEIPLTSEFVDARRGEQRKIMVHYLDPSSEMQKTYKDNAKKANLQTSTDFEVFKYDNPSYYAPSVDFVLASHSWYYIGGEVDTRVRESMSRSLKKFTASTLEKKGIGLIVLHSETSDNFKIRSQMTPQVNPGEKERAGEELSVALSGLGISHEAVIVPTHTDVSSCFQNGNFDPTPVGKNMLSFILRAPWDQQPEVIQNQMRDFITSFVDRNKKEMMFFRDLFIWIPGSES